MSSDYRQYPFAEGKHPPGWVETTVGNIALEIRSGYSSGKHNQTGQGIPHLRPMNVSPVGDISMEDVRYVSPNAGDLRLAKDDVLFTNTSSTVWVGKTALVEKPYDWGFSNHMTRLRVATGMSPEFVARQLHCLCINGYFAFHCKKHINQSSIAGKQLAEDVPFRLPPANEQKRIASKLRRLLIRERRLREDLDALPTLMQQYRTSVLEAACTGRLPDPLYTDKPRDLTAERIKPILLSGQGEALVVGDVSMSQIAMLPTELIQRAQNNDTQAKLLLGLVLKYVAPQDNSWSRSVPAPVRGSHQTLTVDIFPALWIADLKDKAWVPLRVEAKWSPVHADAGTLKHILNPAWLEGNDAGIRLLAKFFGYKELELRLLATAPSDELRQQMESGLAKIVQTLGSDAAQYTELASALVEKKRRDEEKQRNRKFGFAVQEAIKKCLELQHLNLQLVDCGYDYDVYLEKEEPIDSATLSLKLADYLLEVKATTTGEVRLSPKQAETASVSSDRFILCVVDLRGITHDRMEADWTAADVEPRTKFVLGVGKLAVQPHTLVEAAKGCDVGIRNDNALRYGVPVNIWESGISTSDWIAQLAVTS